MAFQPHCSKRTLSQDSEFPHTFSWSSSSETIKGRQLYSHSLSSEMLPFDNFEIVSPITPIPVTFLDRTTLDVGFDHTCLEGLDDLLLHSPTDAYAAICWAEAVDEPSRPLCDHFLSRSPTTSEQDDPSGSLTDDSDSDSDDCRTFNEHSLTALPISAYDLAVKTHISHPSLDSTTSHFYSSFETSEKLDLGPRITHFYPPGSIGLFPIPHRKVRTTGVAALRAYLPLRRKKSAIY
ncbi:hypothetical protein DXG01_010112 [Tephrocybe rancida]|nr:hypothetical protein DXG01_010112 [Tephrocybe rancida]